MYGKANFMKFRQYKVKGFSLVEILVSLLVFSLVLLGVARAYLLVDYQINLLHKKQMMSSLVHELIQRGYRNTSVLYYSQSVWDAIDEQTGAMDCSETQECLSAQLLGVDIQKTDIRDSDIRWFKSQIQRYYDDVVFTLRPCSEQYFICLKIDEQQQSHMEFIVSVN